MESNLAMSMNASVPVNSSVDKAESITFHFRPRTFRGFTLPPVLTLLTAARLLTPLWCPFVHGTVPLAVQSVIVLRVHNLLGWTSTNSGLILLATCLPSFGGPLIGAAADKYGPRWLTTVGFLLAALSLILLRLFNGPGIHQIILLGALLFILGTGLAMLGTPILAKITYVVNTKQRETAGSLGERGAYAQAYGLFSCTYAVGTLTGPLWGGFVEQAAGWKTLTWSLGLLSAVSAVPTIIFTGGLITEKKEKTNGCGE